MLGCLDRLGGDRDCVGSGPGPCRVGGGTVPGGRGVEGWCGGTGQHSVGKARHRHGMARECHGMARECHGGGTADGVPRTFQNNLSASNTLAHLFGPYRVSCLTKFIFLTAR